MTEFPGVAPGQSSVPPGPPGGAQSLSYPPGPYPPGTYRPPQYPQFAPVPPRPTNGLAVASLVVGIVALVTSPLCIGLGLGVVAVAMGVTARRRVKRGEAADGGPAHAGIVLGSMAIVIGLVVGAILVAIFVIGIATDQFNETYQHCLLEHNGMSQYCEQYR